MHDSGTVEQQRELIRTKRGFIAALDQSGGSSPKVLRAYGIADSEYSGAEDMLATMHAMRVRIITSPAFSGDRIIAAILFEDTLDRKVEGLPTEEYLWKRKSIVPFLKIDRGLMDEADGVQLMKPMPGLDGVLARAKKAGIFGTKMRSVIHTASPTGVKAVVDQQFEIGLEILAAGLVPILEPEVDIKSPKKAEAETLLKAELLARLDKLRAGQEVMLKLTLPETDGFYSDLCKHPRVLRVVGLSGGYSQKEASERLARNKGMIASFSRALAEGLTAQQTDAEFNAALAASIERIYQASST